VENPPAEGGCGELSPCDESHEWAKTPGRRRSKEVQSRQGTFKSCIETRIAVHVFQVVQQFWRKERIECNVYAISGCEDYMIDDPLAPFIQADTEALSFNPRLDDKPSSMNRDIVYADL